MPDKAFQDIGDKLTRALVTGDFALYRTLFILPLRVTPRGGTAYVMTDDAELQADFDLYHQIITLHGVTDIFRDVRGVDPQGPDAAIVEMTVHILQRANRIVDPFPSRMHLLRTNGIWRITEIESTEGHINWTLGTAQVGPAGQFEPKEPDDAET